MGFRFRFQNVGRLEPMWLPLKCRRDLDWGLRHVCMCVCVCVCVCLRAYVCMSICTSIATRNLKYGDKGILIWCESVSVGGHREKERERERARERERERRREREKESDTTTLISDVYSWPICIYSTSGKFMKRLSLPAWLPVHRKSAVSKQVPSRLELSENERAAVATKLPGPHLKYQRVRTSAILEDNNLGEDIQ